MPSSATMGSSLATPESRCCRLRRRTRHLSQNQRRAQSRLLTDGFASYRGREAGLGEYYKHTPVVQDQGANAAEFFPIIHTLFSNIKTRLVGTHHGVSAKHLPRYPRKWSYRFNRRNLPDGPDRYLIRRVVECATITYDSSEPAPCRPASPASGAIPLPLGNLL
jgi:hypothetical protein